MSEIDLAKAFRSMEFDIGGERSLNERVLIVDGMNTFIRSFAAIPTLNEDGIHIGGVTGFLKSIGLVSRKIKPTRIVIVFDGKGGSARRKKLFPDYKAKRNPITRLNRPYDPDTTSEDDQEAMKYELKILMQLLQLLPVTIIAMDDVEADDIMAYIVELTRKKGGESIIYSADKDFIQLVDEDCYIWHPMKKIKMDVNYIVEKYGIHPNNFPLYRSILGDTSDNIPGVKGVGEKTILKHFPKFSEESKYTVEQLLEDTEAIPGKIPRKLIEQKNIIDRNIKLMKLTEVEIPTDHKMKVIKKIDSAPHLMNKLALTKAMVYYKVYNTMGDINYWLNSSFSHIVRGHG